MLWPLGLSGCARPHSTQQARRGSGWPWPRPGTSWSQQGLANPVHLMGRWGAGPAVDKSSEQSNAWPRVTQHIGDQANVWPDPWRPKPSTVRGVSALGVVSGLWAEAPGVVKSSPILPAP